MADARCAVAVVGFVCAAVLLLVLKAIVRQTGVVCGARRQQGAAAGDRAC